MLPRLQAEAQTALIEPYFSRDVPMTLYHYTGSVGLAGILESKEIHCTQVQYLNDAQELYYAADLVAERVRDEPDLDEFGAVRTYAVDFASHRSMNRICVASFGEDGDDLGQWRGYGSGSGGGYAIGFYGAGLGEQLKHQRPTPGGGAWNLAPVIYDRADHQEIASAIARLITRACQSAVDEGAGREEAVEQGTTVFLSLLLTLGPLLKDPAFAAECEWRLVSPGVPHGKDYLSFRLSRLLTPYCRFQLCRSGSTLELAEVVVGPGPHQGLNRSAADALRFEHGVVMPAEPSLSQVPYRDW